MSVAFDPEPPVMNFSRSETQVACVALRDHEKSLRLEPGMEYEAEAAGFLAYEISKDGSTSVIGLESVVFVDALAAARVNDVGLGLTDEHVKVLDQVSVRVLDVVKDRAGTDAEVQTDIGNVQVGFDQGRILIDPPHPWERHVAEVSDLLKVQLRLVNGDRDGLDGVWGRYGDEAVDRLAWMGVMDAIGLDAASIEERAQRTGPSGRLRSLISKAVGTVGDSAEISM